jgi:hypothetical protein
LRRGRGRHRNIERGGKNRGKTTARTALLTLAKRMQ